MSNLTCEQFKILLHLYNLNYICNTYDNVCHDNCVNDNCYCYCADNQIYCLDHYYYAWRLFSVLLIAIIFSCCCYGCIMFFKRRSVNQFNPNNHIENNSPPSYQNVYQNVHSHPSFIRQIQEKKYDDITTHPINRS